MIEKSVMSQRGITAADSVAPAGLTEASVEALISRYGESGYLRDLRRSAWDAYQRIPMPGNRDEEWRRTDIRSLRLDALQTLPRLDGTAEESAGLRAALASDDALAGMLVQRNGVESARSLDSELAAKGVVFGTLESVAREHPHLVAEYVAQSVPADDEKFVALATAFRTGGSFLYVPKNVAVDLPIRSVTWGDQAGLAICPRTVIVAETGADVTFIDDYASEGLAHPDTGQGLSSSVVEIVAPPGATVR